VGDGKLSPTNLFLRQSPSVVFGIEGWENDCLGRFKHPFILKNLIFIKTDERQFFNKKQNF
jgi:hypothetical protein